MKFFTRNLSSHLSFFISATTLNFIKNLISHDNSAMFPVKNEPSRFTRVLYGIVIHKLLNILLLINKVIFFLSNFKVFFTF